MVLGMCQYYYTIRDEFCQPLLYTKFKKKEVDRVREERDRIRLMLYRNTLTNAWLVNRLEERGVITEKTEMSTPLAYLIPSVAAEVATGTGFYYSKAKVENRIKLMRQYKVAPQEQHFSDNF